MQAAYGTDHGSVSRNICHPLALASGTSDAHVSATVEMRQNRVSFRDEMHSTNNDVHVTRSQAHDTHKTTKWVDRNNDTVRFSSRTNCKRMPLID
mmetsp:Transcript_6485/g.16140  ORF Transcript_6485/g.16140 Transcript_6485/m.16140 type:complete len:95 (+) Transcript_6485:319-603(+)